MESHTRDKIERDRLYKSMQRQFEEQLDQAKEKLNADLDTVEQLRAALEKSKLNASELEGKLREEVTKNKQRRSISVFMAFPDRVVFLKF